MSETGQNTSVNSSEKTSSADPEKTVATPHFDALAVEQARPAVPLSQLRSGRSWPNSMLLAVALLAGLAGGVIGGIVPMVYLKDNAAQRTDSGSATDEDVVPAHVPSPEQAMSEQRSPQTTPAEALPPSSGQENSAASERNMPQGDGGEARAPQDLEATLRGALEDWVAATNARDIDRQMSFYNPVVNAFYRSRNVSRADVRADKARVYERASSIDIRAGAPDIHLSRDGRTATMLFRKQYAITGGGQDRRGEVLQELRWQRIEGQWRIISERDLRVVR